MVLAGCASPTVPDNSTSSSSPAATSSVEQSAAGIEALNEAIGGIDAAVYAYGVVGAHLRGSAQRLALRAITTLNRQRAGFAAAIGSTINEAGVAYVLPGPVTNATQAKALAELLEMKLIPLFDQVASTSGGPTHVLAVNASRKAAQRAQSWQPASPQ